MKINRNELKALIKECLIEVLADGLGAKLPELVESRQQVPERYMSGKPVPRRAAPPSHRQQNDPYLDAPVKRNLQTEALRNAIKENSGGSSVMSSILADTARTTLPTFLSEGESSSPKLSQLEQINGTPEEIFGEDTASKWADLAFAPSRPGQRVQS